MVISIQPREKHQAHGLFFCIYVSLSMSSQRNISKTLQINTVHYYKKKSNPIVSFYTLVCISCVASHSHGRTRGGPATPLGFDVDYRPLSISWWTPPPERGVVTGVSVSREREREGERVSGWDGLRHRRGDPEGPPAVKTWPAWAGIMMAHVNTQPAGCCCSRWACGKTTLFCRSAVLPS